MHVWKGGGLWLWVLSLCLVPDPAEGVVYPAHQGSDGLEQEQPHQAKRHPKERTTVGVRQEEEHHRHEASEVLHCIDHLAHSLALPLLAGLLRRLFNLCVHTA